MAVKEHVREGLRVAAVQALLTHGPQVSMEVIAGLAGVGRRTAFRYFATREDLLAAGVDWIVDTYIARMPQRGDRPPDRWLRELARESAGFLGSAGPAYVALLASEWESAPMREAMARRATSRRAFSEDVALEAWRASGRAGKPPQRLVHACLLCLGPFAHYGLRIDGALDANHAGRLAGDVLVDVLRAVTTQR